MLAAGVPMLTAGDELGRTQGGNNNAYCQDSPISWVHWDTRHDWAGLTDLTRRLLALRAEHPVFRRTTFRHGEQLVDTTDHPTGRRNLAWFGGGRHEMTAEDWQDRTAARWASTWPTTRPTATTTRRSWSGSTAAPTRCRSSCRTAAWADTYTVVAHTGDEGELPTEKIPAGIALCSSPAARSSSCRSTDAPGTTRGDPRRPTRRGEISSKRNQGRPNG